MFVSSIISKVCECFSMVCIFGFRKGLSFLVNVFLGIVLRTLDDFSKMFSGHFQVFLGFLCWDLLKNA